MKKITLFILCTMCLGHANATMDHVTCVKWAMQQPLPNASKIGFCHHEYGDKNLGRKVLTEAAFKGDEEAFLQLVAFANKDPKISEEQLYNTVKEISATGLPMAQYVLGVFHYDGYGTPVNEELGTTYMRLAAKKKNSIYYLVGRTFEERGHPDHANLYWELCAARDNVKCIHELAVSRFSGRGFKEKHYGMCRDLLEKGCSLGHEESCSFLKDLTEIENACSNGLQKACDYLKKHGA